MNRADHEFLVFRLDPEVAIRWISRRRAASQSAPGYDAIALPRASVEDNLSRRSTRFKNAPWACPKMNTATLSSLRNISFAHFR